MLLMPLRRKAVPEAQNRAFNYVSTLANFGKLLQR